MDFSRVLSEMNGIPSWMKMKIDFELSKSCILVDLEYFWFFLFCCTFTKGFRHMRYILTRHTSSWSMGSELCTCFCSVGLSLSHQNFEQIYTAPTHMLVYFQNYCYLRPRTFNRDILARVYPKIRERRLWWHRPQKQSRLWVWKETGKLLIYTFWCSMPRSSKWRWCHRLSVHRRSRGHWTYILAVDFPFCQVWHQQAHISTHQHRSVQQPYIPQDQKIWKARKLRSTSCVHRTVWFSILNSSTFFYIRF